MPKTQINCPQCRQPIVADVEQLFDVGQDPQLKQIFLSGGFNLANCPHCGYQGMLASPLVYHDLEKELLLTYFPPELALPINEQEKIIGPLINRVVANLPQEKRKGYLFNPKTMLTLQLMLETVLEGEGITKEMIQAQQERMNLIQRLLGASEDAQVEIIHQEDGMIDDVFFGLLSRLMESAVMDRQEGVAGKLAELEQALVAHSTKGKELRGEAEEIENAMQTIQALGKDLTREKLLDLIVDSPSDTRLRAYSRLARPGLDYTFFQMLSEKVEQAENQEKARLMEIRDKLLAYTREVDEEIANRTSIAQKNVEAVLKAKDIRATLEQNIEAVDEFFVQTVTQALNSARETGDLERSSRLQQVLDIIEELSAPPAELALIESLLESADDESVLNGAVEAASDEITPELLQMVNALVTQTEANLERVPEGEKEQQLMLVERLQAIYKAVLGSSMRRSFRAKS